MAVAAAQTADPEWLEELLPIDASDSWTFISWFRERLSSPRAARYAAAAGDGLKPRIARAVDVLLRTQQPPCPNRFSGSGRSMCTATIANH